MNLFAKTIDALHESRRRQAERVIRRYSHLVVEAQEEERKHQRRLQLTQDVSASLSLVRRAPPASAIACTALVAAALINTGASAGDAGFPTACALREIPVLSAIEEHGAEQDVSADRLAYATFKMLTARRACYEGNVDVALRLYDEILTTELAKSGS